MKKIPHWVQTGVMLLVTAAWLTVVNQAQAADVSCLKCHDKVKQQFDVSAHAEAGLSCVDCHGGNPKAIDETAHTADNFKRPDNKRTIAELCAHCHSDVRRMNPYGLPTDQLDRYKTSKHGEQLFQKGDQNVAVCTDCHGAHDIHKVKSPQSHVYPTNVPETCGRCHSDPKRMAAYKLPTDQLAKYKTSYHAELLLKKGDLSAPTCVTCHGNHGAVPPGTVEVGQVCGKCHVRQRELFAKTPHAEAAGAGLFNECVSCHGNHGIQKATVELFEKTCVQCHAKDPKPLAVRDSMVALLRRAKSSYDKAATRLREATIQGLATEDEQLLLQEARTQVTQLEALQHTLSPEQLQPVAARAEELTKQTRAGIKRLERIEGWMRLSLLPVWIFLTVMAVLFWAKRLQIEQKEKS